MFLVGYWFSTHFRALVVLYSCSSLMGIEIEPPTTSSNNTTYSIRAMPYKKIIDSLFGLESKAKALSLSLSLSLFVIIW